MPPQPPDGEEKREKPALPRALRRTGEIGGIDLWPLIVRDTDKVSSGPGFSDAPCTRIDRELVLVGVVIPVTNHTRKSMTCSRERKMERCRDRSRKSGSFASDVLQKDSRILVRPRSRVQSFARSYTSAVACKRKFKLAFYALKMYPFTRYVLSTWTL